MPWPFTKSAARDDESVSALSIVSTAKTGKANFVKVTIKSGEILTHDSRMADYEFSEPFVEFTITEPVDFAQTEPGGIHARRITWRKAQVKFELDNLCSQEIRCQLFVTRKHKESGEEDEFLAGMGKFVVRPLRYQQDQQEVLLYGGDVEDQGGMQTGFTKRPAKMKKQTMGTLARRNQSSVAVARLMVELKVSRINGFEKNMSDAEKMEFDAIIKERQDQHYRRLEQLRKEEQNLKAKIHELNANPEKNKVLIKDKETRLVRVSTMIGNLSDLLKKTGGRESPAPVTRKSAVRIAEEPSAPSGDLQVEIAKRQAAEARVADLERKVADLEARLAAAQNGGEAPPPPSDSAFKDNVERQLRALLGYVQTGQVGAEPINTSAAGTPLSLAAATERSSGSGADLGVILAKLENLDKLDNIMRMMSSGAAVMAAGGAMNGTSIGNSNRTMQDITEEMDELMKIVVDESLSEKDREDANIKFEKLANDLDKHPEYLAKKREEQQKWFEENEPINKACREKLSPYWTDAGIQKSQALAIRASKLPELRLIPLTEQEISVKHQNDYKKFGLRGLYLDEVRALFHALPEFKRDQKVQQAFKESVKNKLMDMVGSGKTEESNYDKIIADYEKKKSVPPPRPPKDGGAPPRPPAAGMPPPPPPGGMPPPPPPGGLLAPKKKVGGGNAQADLMAELLKKRQPLKAVGDD
eukprot:Clim_evm109s157 gene=Clim_evmTU109s157